MPVDKTKQLLISGLNSTTGWVSAEYGPGSDADLFMSRTVLELSSALVQHWSGVDSGDELSAVLLESDHKIHKKYIKINVKKILGLDNVHSVRHMKSSTLESKPFPSGKFRLS